MASLAAPTIATACFTHQTRNWYFISKGTIPEEPRCDACANRRINDLKANEIITELEKYKIQIVDNPGELIEGSLFVNGEPIKGSLFVRCPVTFRPLTTAFVNRKLSEAQRL